MVGLVPPEVDQVPLIEWDGVPPSTMSFCTAVISFIIVYIQSIGSGMVAYSGLFNDTFVLVLFSSLIPVKPKLTQAEQDSFLLSKELKQKLGPELFQGWESSGYLYGLFN